MNVYKGQPIKWRQYLPTICGFALLMATTAFYAYHGILKVHQDFALTQSQGKVLVAAPGDVSIRDVPKALAIMQGDIWGDAHYVGEVNWYPFVTPLLAAMTAKLSGQSIHFAYATVVTLTNAYLLAAVGLLLYLCLGVPGFLALPVVILLGLFWPGGCLHPCNTARLSLVLFVVVAGALWERSPSRISRRTTVLLAVLGGLTGLLGLWHGASFFTAGAVSAVLLSHWVIAGIKAGLDKLRILMPVALYVGIVAGFLSLLVAPQIIHYGRLQQHDAARLWLEYYYQGGNLPQSFFSLALLPGGINSLFLFAFLAGFLPHPTDPEKLRRFPLLIGYIFTKTLGHFGFVLNSQEYPWLARLSSKLLVAPPHTFDGTGNFLLVLIKLLVMGMLVKWLIKCLFTRLSFHSSSNSVNQPFLNSWQLGSFLGFLLSLYGVLFFRFPRIGPLDMITVDRALYDFAQATAKIVGTQTTVYQANDLIQLAPLKIFHLGSSDHANPYVQIERGEAQGHLKSMLNAPLSLAEDILQHYRIQYAVTSPSSYDLVVRLCGGKPVLETAMGYTLFELESRCYLPDLDVQDTPPLSRVNNFNVLLDTESPLVITGVAPNTGDNALEYARVPVGDLLLTKLTIRGKVIGNLDESGITPRVVFWGEQGFVGETWDNYPVSGQFKVDFWFIPPAGTTNVTPRLSFAQSCFSKGQQIVVEDYVLVQEHP